MRRPDPRPGNRDANRLCQLRAYHRWCATHPCPRLGNALSRGGAWGRSDAVAFARFAACTSADSTGRRHGTLNSKFRRLGRGRTRIFFVDHKTLIINDLRLFVGLIQKKYTEICRFRLQSSTNICIVMSAGGVTPPTHSNPQPKTPETTPPAPFFRRRARNVLGVFAFGSDRACWQGRSTGLSCGC